MAPREGRSVYELNKKQTSLFVLIWNRLVINLAIGMGLELEPKAVKSF